MADYGEHEDCYPPTGCGKGCPYNSGPVKQCGNTVAHPAHSGGSGYYGNKYRCPGVVTAKPTLVSGKHKGLYKEGV